MNPKRSYLLVIAAAFGITAVVILCVIFYNYLMQPKIVFLNVGQGDAILLMDHNNQILIDAGRDASVLGQLGKFMPPWDRTIELAIATHPDSDHVAGYKYIYDRYNVTTFATSDGNFESDIATLVMINAKTKSHLIHVKYGDTAHIGLWKLSILWPMPGSETMTDSNDRSVVTYATFNNNSFLLTGDASKKVEAFMLARNVVPHADILKLGHHGSKTASTLHFLQVVNPKTAIISAGCNNSYGHPHKEVIDRLLNLRIPFRSTCTEGAIVYRF